MLVRSLLLFCMLPIAPATAQSVVDQARSDAKANLQVIKEFVTERGQLQTDIDSYSEGGTAFRPVVQMPSKDSDLVLQLCRILNADSREPPYGCEFERLNHCEIEFKQSLKLTAQLSRSVPWSSWSIHYEDSGKND